MFDQLFNEMHVEDAVGLMLAAQLAETPDDVQIIVRTTVFDKSIGGLRDQNQYAIKATKVAEHKLTLGLFDHIAFIDDHPLLYHHNAPRLCVFVSSRAESADAVMHDIEDVHTEVYDTWRDLPMDLNSLSTPEQVLDTGFGLLGEMPEPFAKAVADVLNRHGVKHNLVTEEEPPSQAMKLLAIDDSYLVAAEFSIELIS